MAESKNWKEFTTALQLYTYAPVSLVYADVHGDIGYYVPGRLPIRAIGHSGRYPVMGNGTFDWKGFIPFEQLPHLHNPKENIIVSANNRANPKNYKYEIGYNTAPGFRATRIFEKLESLGNQLTVEDMMIVQLDQFAREFLDYQKFFQDLNLNETNTSYHTRWLNKLKQWDGDASISKQSNEATIFVFWYRCYRRIAEKEMGHLRFAHEPFLRLSLHNISYCPPDRNCHEFAVNCLKTSLDQLNLDNLQYRWGNDIHNQNFINAGLNTSPLQCMANRKVKTGGTDYSPNVASLKDPILDSNGRYQVESDYGAYFRMIIHSGEPDSKWVIAMGQSGNLFSSNYDDQYKMYGDGQYSTLGISKVSSELNLLPK
jgi:penicillin G amidase